jgi:hypothetical protein
MLKTGVYFNGISSENVMQKLLRLSQEKIGASYLSYGVKVEGDSKLLSGFPWPIIFKPETTK